MNQPASTCGNCSREGTKSLDQTVHRDNGSGKSTSNDPLLSRIRFHCSCGAEWLVDAEEAEAQGRFLDRCRLR